MVRLGCLEADGWPIRVQGCRLVADWADARGVMTFLADQLDTPPVALSPGRWAASPLSDKSIAVGSPFIDEPP